MALCAPRWSPVQWGDHSFNASDASFTANPHITVYYNGQLVYGTEP
jgi:hypothetical protein